MQKYTGLSGIARLKALIKPRLLPGGGSAGQALTKSGSADYAAVWSNMVLSGAGKVLTMRSMTQAAFDAEANHSGYITFIVG